MSKASFNWEDPLLLDTQLSEDERMVRDAAAEYAQGRLMPRILEAYRNETTDPAIFREMGELGLLGPTIPTQYGGPGLNYVAYGLIAREVERRELQQNVKLGPGGIREKPRIAQRILVGLGDRGSLRFRRICPMLPSIVVSLRCPRIRSAVHPASSLAPHCGRLALRS